MASDLAQSEEDVGALSLGFLEALYTEYLRDPGAVSDDWRKYFDRVETNGFEQKPLLGPSFRPRSVFNPATERANGAPPSPVAAPKPAQVESAEVPSPASIARRQASAVADALVRQDRVDQLVRAYRVRGHMIAAIDPLGLPRARWAELEPEFYGFSEADLDAKFSSRTITGASDQTLRQILERLRKAYCGSVGVQFMHIDDPEVKNWLQTRLEDVEHRKPISRAEQLRILTKLTDAVIFEEFIQKKFLGAKSFSLEGSESLIPLLVFLIERAGECGVKEIVLGMAHRGRLNVLANIMGKSPRDIFREFEDKDPELFYGSGDVKYHLGHSSNFKTISGDTVHLSLCFNPSHLEYVNPVVQGRTRAKQDRAHDLSRGATIALLIHGDAAFAGEGVTQESLNLSQLEAYTTGGTIHVVVNNQIGFTTPPDQARSTVYATDVAKMLQVPIFHVNGEDPEAVAWVVRLATDFRDEFRCDVVIDMYGYRRHGHNESDEPAFTQPLLYAAIAQRPSVRDAYLEKLLPLGITREEGDRIAVERREHLEQELSEARRKDYVRAQDWLGGHWKGYLGGPEAQVPDVDTGVDKERLSELLERLATVPANFRPHKKIERILAQRREMAEGARPLDWGTAELLAFATLVTENVRVRMTGQDAGRGTFSSRHGVLYDVKDGHNYMPLLHVAPRQAPIEIYNSPLSEVGVLGFEYGYSLDWPDGLVLWEAQFGDFANCAQVIIDQFLVSAEDKWKRLSGLVLLLPHGFEGQGPEHSSARLERFLVLAAEENIQVVQPSTPAQYFHCLRRQALRRWRKPLIVMTPKSLLRHPRTVSTLDECAVGPFRRMLPDTTVDPAKVRRVLMCSGRIINDLEKERAERKRNDVAIVRVEQFYPLPDEHVRAAIDVYAKGTPIYWVQDEPENMGAWRHLRARFGQTMYERFPFAGIARAESASPATGSPGCHKLEHQEVMERAFAGLGSGE